MDGSVTVAEIAKSRAVEEARAGLHETDATTIAEMRELVAIPAPPFGEAERGARVARRFRELGVDDVSVDDVGNVIAVLPGSDAAHEVAVEAAAVGRDTTANVRVATGDGTTASEGGTAAAGGPPATPAEAYGGAVIIVAHLDTVFPAGTDLTIRQEGDRIFAPGIADNARGLAALLALARVIQGAGIRTIRPLAFVATVGEEGEGDLRGVKHLFREGSPWREAHACIALDGTGRSRIVSRALGSTRLRVTVKGPGGHSWADAGHPNPIHALGTAIADIAMIRLPRNPRSTVTVARMAGGTSVNAIPASGSIELDIRSEGAALVADLEARVRDLIRRAVSRANGRRRPGTPPLKSRIETIGRRPAGETPAGSPILRNAEAATRLLGGTPELIAASTDASMPISLGIPSIAIGAGGESGGMHTTGEWYANAGGPEGIERALLIALALAGVAGRERDQPSTASSATTSE